MIVYRLSKSKYANSLSGLGAEKYGGRWNNRGTSVIYTSSSRALCTVEIAVHTPLGNIPIDYSLVTIEVPEVQYDTISTDELPKDWNSAPHGNDTQKIGDQFIREAKSLLLKVPSAVVQGEFNYLINPNHPDFIKVKIATVEAFDFDSRLFKH